MGIARRAFACRQTVVNVPRLAIQRREKILSTMLLGLCFIVLGSSGCGQTAKPVTSPTTGLVDSYFGGPFEDGASGYTQSSSTFDHTTNRIGVSAFVSTATAQVPTLIMSGTFAPADTGFLSITENFATRGSGAVLVPQNPALSGAWAVEIPGAGALANLLSWNGPGSPVPVSPAPTAMAENATCPNFSSQTPFLYVTVPKTGLTGDTADYGKVNIDVQGSALTFNAQPFLVGPVAQNTSTVTGGCSNSNLGALTAYPLNSFGLPSNQDLISIGASGFLVSSFANVNAGGVGAFGGGTGVLGVAEPSGPVNVSAVVGAKYNGFFYAPQNAVSPNNITVLASSFGNHTATSLACSALQSSLMANNGQGANTVPVLPSANSLYGGEFLTSTGAGAINDPSGTSGSESCDVAIDLGTQDSATNGLFPKATVFIGSNYPPFSASMPWTCPNLGTICAVSFPAAAVVGQLQGQYVIFVAASAASSPVAAQLPVATGNTLAQPVGIYLFQKAQ